MTTLNGARVGIYNKFLTAWGSTTPVARDNERNEFADGGLPWVRLTVRHTSATQDTIGQKPNRKFARFGSAFVQVYVLFDEGTKNADDLAKQAADVFEGERVVGTSICFKDVTVKEQGRDENWYIVLVEAEFEYFEEK